MKIRSVPPGLTILLVTITAPALAQSAGSVRGAVLDESGPPVANASVRLTDENSGFTHRVVSDSQGRFFAGAVEPGHYAIEVAAEGFATSHACRIHLSAGEALDLTLTLGTAESSAAARPCAERPDGAAREGPIASRAMEQHAVLGRSPMELLRVLPGVIAPDSATYGTVGIDAGFGGRRNGFSINGTRPENVAFTLDGASLRDVGLNSGLGTVPNNEFVSEVKIQTGSYAAEFGSRSVQVKAVTRGGRADFHGALYYYGRPNQLQANDRSRSYVRLERPESRLHYPGVTLSGPILVPGSSFNKDRHKTFFFLGYEIQQQQIDAGSSLAVVPPLAMRQGDFNSYLGGADLGLGRTLQIPGGWPNAGQPVPGRDFTPYITPSGRALMDLYPEPNYNDSYNRYNYATTHTSGLDRHQGVLRVDHTVGGNTRAYLRLARDKEATEHPTGLGAIELPTPIVQEATGLSAVLSLTTVLSQSATNEVVVSWSRLRRGNHWKDDSLMLKSTYGITDIDNPLRSSPYVPGIVSRYDATRPSLWFDQDVKDLLSHTSLMRFQDGLSKVIGAHALKLGVAVERQSWEANNYNHANGQLVFGPWGAGGTGNDVADMLAGRPAQFEIGAPAPIGRFEAWSIEAFAQDSWRIGRKVTLEYGVRAGYWSVNRESNGLGAIFQQDRYDPAFGVYLNQARSGAWDASSGESPLINGLAYAALGDVDQQLTRSRPLLFMPRVGFVWDTTGDGDTLVRGGLGLFHAREQGNAQYGPLRLTPNSLSATLDAHNYGADCPTCGLTYAGVAGINPYDALALPGTIFTPNPNDLAWPKAYNASLSLARRLPRRNVLEVAYVGSWGRNLAAVQQQNVVGTDPAKNLMAYSPAPLLRAGAAETVYARYKTYPTLGDVVHPAYAGVSDYHSMQTTLSRHSGPFQYFLAYTLSRSKGTVAADLEELDPIGDFRTRDYGVLPTDRTHVLNASWSWQLGERVKDGPLRHLVNGWTLSGISTWQSGRPFRPHFSGLLGSNAMARAWWGTSDFAGRGDIMPAYGCDPNGGGGADLGERIWDVGCIGIPGLGENGPSFPPNTLRAPGKSFHDLTLLKDLALGGAMRLQIRLAAFNLFNQAYPDMVNFTDIYSFLDTICAEWVSGVPDGAGGTGYVCNPSGGFAFSDSTLANFGRVITKRGHRTIEVAARLFF